MKKFLVFLIVMSLVLAVPILKTTSKTVMKTKQMDLCVATRPFILENCESFSREMIKVTFHNATYVNGTGEAYFSIRDPEGIVYFWLNEGRNYHFLPKSGKVLKLHLNDILGPTQVMVSYVWCPAMIYPRTITVAEEDLVGTTYGGYGASARMVQIYPNPNSISISEYDYRYDWVGSANVGEGAYTEFTANGYRYKFTYTNYAANNKANIQFIEYN